MGLLLQQPQWMFLRSAGYALSGFCKQAWPGSQHCTGLAHNAGISSTSSSSQVHTTNTTSSTLKALREGGLTKLLVANRGEIACRVMATARRLGVKTVAVYSEADRHAAHVQAADEAYCIGGAAARDSYLRVDALLAAIRASGAQAVHPGYGFLSENAAFAEALAKEGVRFVGPPAAAIRAMGDKAAAKAMMSAAGVPVVPGYHGEDQSMDRLLHEASQLGFPLLVKAVSGGGGKGMKLAMNMKEVPEALASARREAAASFGDDRLLIERYIMKPRHVEVQVMCDSHGNGLYFFDRDCSVQRRHQKIIEEAPAPGLPGEFHAMIGEAAVRAAHAAGYVNAGTVEFIVDAAAPMPSGGKQGTGPDAFFFMEMNTRLQVEHPVTEAVAGVDLVELQLAVAAGGKLPLTQQDVFHGDQVKGAGPHGHSFEARLYAESPRQGFLPGGGRVRRWRPPPDAITFALPSQQGSIAQAPSSTYVRVDSGVREGDEVGTFYDPLIAKIITWGPSREEALAALRTALAQTQVAGLTTNLAYLQRLSAHPAFINLELDTGFVKRHEATLLAPQPLPPWVAALAGVARYLTNVQEQASAAGPNAQGGGAWGISDAMRPGYRSVRVLDDMEFPEGSLQSAAALRTERAAAAKKAAQAAAAAAKRQGAKAAAAAAGTPASSAASSGGQSGSKAGKAPSSSISTSSTSDTQGLAMRMTILGERDYDLDVTLGGPAAPPEGCTSERGCSVRVRGVKLSKDSRHIEAEVDGRRVSADVVTFTSGNHSTLVLWVAGEASAYEFRWPRPHWSKTISDHSHSAAAGGAVTSPMPGRVVKVLVKDGDKVAKGQPVVVIEAMKMEHQVTARQAGTVQGLAVGAGAQVSDGQVLLNVVEGDEDQHQEEQKQ